MTIEEFFRAIPSRIQTQEEGKATKRPKHTWSTVKHYSPRHIEQVCSICKRGRRVTQIGPDRFHVYDLKTKKSKEVKRSQL